jgi:transcriptional regulator with XRE-family HTH domain
MMFSWKQIAEGWDTVPLTVPGLSIGREMGGLCVWHSAEELSLKLKRQIINVNQQEHISNADKGKLLVAARKRLGLNQAQMAEKLNLDPSYLSQLENGRQKVGDFYVERAEELAREFENANQFRNSAEARAAASDYAAPTRESCLQYLERFLDACTDAAKLGWTLVELREHFPLDKWERLNSVPDAVAAQAAKRAVAEVQQPGAESARSHKAASTTGKISSRASRAGAPSGAPPAPPKPAPK